MHTLGLGERLTRLTRLSGITCASWAIWATFVILTGTAHAAAYGATHRQTIGSPDATQVAIEPNGISISVAQTRLFTATVTNPLGLIVPGGVTWTLDSSAGTLVSTGPFTAMVQVGTSTGIKSNVLTATFTDLVGGVSTGRASYTITAGSLTAITIQPAVTTLIVGGTSNFTATGYDAYDNPIPNFSATWSVSPTVGTLTSSSATTMTLQALTTPGLYASAIKAANGSVFGLADVLVQAGPPASVVITPSASTVAINAAQTFHAGVYDKYGNPLPLGVTWLAQGGTLEAVSANSTTYRAGTSAGTFAHGVVAANGQVAGAVTITIPADPPSRISLTASPSSIKTDGIDSSTILANVLDAFGNPAGGGSQVLFAVTHCPGVCQLSPLTGVANTDGRVASTLHATYRSPTQTLSAQINVSAQLKNVGTASSGTITITGSFVPFTQFLPVTLRMPFFNNHTACNALTLTPPQSVTQPPDQAYNLYRFVASQIHYSVHITAYATTGQLSVYRIRSDQCAANGAIDLELIASQDITTSDVQTTFGNTAFEAGASYLLALNTTGPASSQSYTLSIGS